MAFFVGEEGFEPPHDGTRTRCLTAWLLSKIISFVFYRKMPTKSNLRIEK